MSAMKPDAWAWINRDDECEQIEWGLLPAGMEHEVTSLFTLATIRKWLEEAPSQAMKDALLGQMASSGSLDKAIRAMLSAKLMEMEK